MHRHAEAEDTGVAVAEATWAVSVVTGPGLNIVGRDGVSTRTVRAVPCSTAAQETDGTTTCVGLQ